jgi:hypothetical protein
MRHQRGYIYEHSGAFYVRYYEMIDGVRKQKAKKLCPKDRQSGYGSPSAKAVRELAEDFLRMGDSALIESEIERLKALLVKKNTPEGVTPLTVVAFWDTIYLPFIEQNLKHSTVWGYKQVWNQHLKSTLAQ